MRPHEQKRRRLRLRVLADDGVNALPLGRVELAGIDPARAGVPRVQVSFKLQEEGMLVVTAQDHAAAGGTRQLLIRHEVLEIPPPPTTHHTTHHLPPPSTTSREALEPSLII